MITLIQRIFKVNLNSDELETLSKAHLILDEIVTNAIKKELDIIHMGDTEEDYSINDLSTCAMMLYDLCMSGGQLEGH